MSLPRRNSKIDGENHYRVTDSNTDIVALKELYASGNYSIDQIAEMYKFSRKKVYLIVSGKRWKVAKIKKKEENIIENNLKKELKFRNDQDIIGKAINNWTILKKTAYKNNNTKYECQCVCGFIKESRRLRISHLKCPNCLPKNKNLLSKIGQKFDSKLVLDLIYKEKNNKKIPYYKLRCECGREYEIRSYSLERYSSMRCVTCKKVKKCLP